MNNKESIVVIGDVHGLTTWEQAVTENPDSFILFLGDFFDPYENISYKVMMENFDKILSLKRSRPNDVVLLLGNHDGHYFDKRMPQSTRMDDRHREDIAKMFTDNMDIIQYAYQIGKCIFTHAGMSEKWFTEHFHGDRDANIAEQLNHPKPEQEKAVFNVGEARGNYWGAVGGIFWADISELEEPLVGYTQVVGHNRVKDVTVRSKNGGTIIFCDCLWNGKWLKKDIKDLEVSPSHST